MKFSKEMLRAARDKQEDILQRVELFQDDLTQEAEHELQRQFNLTDKQAQKLMEEA
jgi:hypothetical protein